MDSAVARLPHPGHLPKGRGRSSWLPSIDSDRSWLSMGCRSSVLSLGADLCILSAGSLLSVGSAGSLLSFGSAGSILSIGSAGSILSYKSAGSILSVRSAGCILGTDQTGVIGVGGGARQVEEDRPPAVTRLATLLALAGLVAAALDR